MDRSTQYSLQHKGTHSQNSLSLQEKGGEKPARRLIKDCVDKVVSTVSKTKEAWGSDTRETLAAMKPIMEANKGAEKL